MAQIPTTREPNRRLTTKQITMDAKDCLHKLNRLNTLLDKYGGSLTMSKKDLALWNIWYSRGQRLKEKFIQQYAESYASQQMPSEEEITKEAVRINDGNLDRYKKGMHYNSDWKAGAMWLKSLQQENQTEE